MNLDHPNNFIVSRLQNRVMLGHNQETRVVKADPANYLDLAVKRETVMLSSANWRWRDKLSAQLYRTADMTRRSI